MPSTLIAACAERVRLRREIAEHALAAANRDKDLKAQLMAVNETIELVGEGLDPANLVLARQVLKLGGAYSRGGEERGSVVRDAIDWLATGKSAAYQWLEASDYGTKNYDRWRGQRCDCEWGGPRHGSIVFSVGLKDRKRRLTDEEREAAIYYLVNIERIETAEARAA